MTTESTKARRTGDHARNPDGARLWPPPREGWLPACGVALIFAGHWLYGALVNDVALALSLFAAALLTACLAAPSIRTDLQRLRGLAAPGVCFALVLLVGLWTLTPYVPGGPHPVWAYVGISPGASTVDKSATAMELIKLLGLASFFAVGAATGGRDDRARYAAGLFLAVGLAFSIWALVGAASGHIVQRNGNQRVEAHFGNANTAGTLFAVLLMFAVAELVRRIQRRRKSDKAGPVLLAGAAAFALLVCLLATASRGGAMAALGGLALYLGLQVSVGKVRPTRAFWSGLAAAAALLAVVAIAGDRLLTRALASQEDSVLRAQVWALHWRAFLDSPLLGYGLGTSSTVNTMLISSSTFDTLWSIRGILNVYLQWLEQAGLIGALPMFACIGLLIWTTARNTLRRSRMVGILCALLAVDAVFLLHGFTDFGLEVFSLAAMWSWLLGLQFALAQGSARR